MSSLRIENLTKHFGSNVALKNVSLSINDREFMVLLGPTGAGKTTALRCMAGLEKPDEGEVFLDDDPVKGKTPAARDLAFVFQNYALYPRKTVYQNIAFPLQARQMSRAEIDDAIKRIAAMLHIGHLLDRKPTQLSGGEQQRVALGRAMVRRPHAFLMDEPLTNLDFKLRTEMRSELKRIQRELNETFFYVTNDQVEAMSMGDKIAVLDHGVIQQIGAPQEVYEHPANLFVAGFIGNPRMNLLKCSFDRETATLIDADGAWRLPLPQRMRAAMEGVSNTDSLLFGVRAEDVALSESADGGDSIPGDVYVTEPLGDRTIYDLKVGQGIFKAKTPPTYRFAPGKRLNLSFNLDRVHVFDAKTQQIIF